MTRPSLRSAYCCPTLPSAASNTSISAQAPFAAFLRFKINEGVRQTVADIWKHQRENPHLPLRLNHRVLSRYQPSNKVFLYTVATQLRIAGYDMPFGFQPNDQ